MFRYVLLQFRNFQLLPISLPFIGLIALLMLCCVYYLQGHFEDHYSYLYCTSFHLIFSFLYKRKGVTSPDRSYPIGCQFYTRARYLVPQSPLNRCMDYNKFVYVQKNRFCCSIRPQRYKNDLF